MEKPSYGLVDATNIWFQSRNRCCWCNYHECTL